MTKKPETITAYIDAAPSEGQPLLCALYALLRKVAPDAQEVIKWGNPFFVEPRFLFAFSAHKAHAGFVATLADLEPFRKDLSGYQITPKGIVQLPYKKPLPENIIRKIAKQRVKAVAARKDDSFW